MVRTPFSFLSEPVKGFVSVLQVILLTGFGLSANAKPYAPQRSRASAAAANRDSGALAETRMALYQFQTRLSIKARSAWSALNPPSEFDRLRSQFEEPLIATGPTSAIEDAALLKLLRSFRDRSAEDDFSALVAFVKDHPQSAWRGALLTNLGLLYYHYGYFSRAIDSWSQAWREGRTHSDPLSKPLVDRALAELARMHARLGHADALEALFKDIGDYRVMGSATEILTGARDGLWMMRNDPGVSYLCGPMALRNLLLEAGATKKQIEAVEAFHSGPNGVAFNAVVDLATKAGVKSEIVYRLPGQAVPLPSIVHWKVNHYAALLDFTNGKYHVKDPTFGTDLWITPKALDAEASGYFLTLSHAPASTSGWKPVSTESARRIYGMGFTTQDVTGRSTCNKQEGGHCAQSGCPVGLCGYGISELTVSLNLHDIPVGYTPPKGPSVKVGITYNQREDSQPATFAWFNVGPKWTLGFLSYIQDDPSSPGIRVSRYAADGGSTTYAGYSSATRNFTPETSNASVLTLTSTSPVMYTRNFSDGHREIYSVSNGATTAPRRIFLTKIIDAAGNALMLNYDAQLRLTSITDATGRDTTFAYELAARPLLVTTITDPFGRSAHLSYDSFGRLNQITDVLGLTSQFTYDASSLINALTTPYGTTRFAYSDSVANPTNGVTRVLTVTDPLGNTERMDFATIAVVPGSDPPQTVPVGMDTYNNSLFYRSSYHWDQHAYAIAPNDYSRAQRIHWHHWSANQNYAADSIESIKNPLENRVWFNYAGQSASYFSGTYDQPTAIGRVLDDGTSQITKLAYNISGNVTDMIDPIGRETQLSYAANNIDLLTVKQKTSAAGFSTIAQFSYNTQHLPLTYTDASGQTTILGYNTAGQLTSVTNALGEVTQYEYDSQGYLKDIINANGKTQASFTYDVYGDIAAVPDSEGYIVSFQHDALDRVTLETFPDGTTRRYEYTNLDLTSITDRQGNKTQYGYDVVRNLVSITDPLNRVTRFGYWENRALKSLTDPRGNVTTWNIDIQNRVTGKQYADGSLEASAYENTTSRLKSVTDALGQVKTFTYGKDDTPINIAYSHAVNPTPNVSFAYDPFFRRVASMTDGTGTRAYSYQPIGSPGALQLAQESGPYTNDSIAYQYDTLSRLGARTVDSSTESFAYDKLSRLTAHDTALGTFNLGYLGETGQLKSQIISTGTVGTTWDYESNINDRRLKAIRNSGATRSFNFTTTPENLISRIEETAPLGASWPTKTWNYQYDDAYRLTGASSSAGNYGYQLDGSDNIRSFQLPSGTTSASYNNLNQITNRGTLSYQFDKNGNVLDDGLRTYTWDAENRLLSITSKSNPALKTKFRYDGLGRRIAINTGANAGVETRYLWCGEQLCQARTPADTVQRRYYAEGEYLPLGGTSLYYAQDQLGSVRDVLATQTGSRVASFDYEPYGNASQSAGRVSTDFRYAGLFYDQQDGLYLSNTRVYSPTHSKWLSRDPIGEKGGVNIYAYVDAAPIYFGDRTGLAKWDDPRLNNPAFTDPTFQGRPTYTPSACAANEPIWVCTRGLGGQQGDIPYVCPLCHEFVACDDPNTTPPNEIRAFGKQPRALNPDGSAPPGSSTSGPGYVSLEQYAKEAGNFSHCTQKQVCPSEKQRMCQSGPTKDPYSTFSSVLNCQGWANGRSQ